MRNAIKIPIGIAVLLICVFLFVESFYPLFRGINRLKKMCEHGDSLACYKVGTMYETGSDMSPNRQQAVYYYRNSCSLDRHWGCEEVLRLEDPKESSKSK